MAISAVSATTLREAPPPRRQRLLEDERWLAFVLLVPTIVLLGMFIAYPFIRGILLSVTNSRVGMPGDFVGLANFYKIFNDGIFLTSVYNTFLYTGVTTVFKLALGLWLAMLLNRNFRGKAFTRAFIRCLSLSRPCSRLSPGSGCSTRRSAFSIGSSTISA
jgi:multiple sugar transport system permease protein